MEDVIHLQLYCTKFNDIRQTLSDIFTDDNFIKDLNDLEVIKLLLANGNTITMFATAKFLLNALTIRSQPS